MAKPAKLDLFKKFHSEYVMPRQPVFVMVGPAKYITITGHGAPGGEQFKAHVSALYAVAFTMKMAEKTAGYDYKVCHLEGQWWAEDGTDFRAHKPADWEWRLMIRVPEFITQKELDTAVEAVIEKGKAALASDVRLEEIAEGRCVQVLHVGPYADEHPAVQKIQNFAEGKGLHLRGPHHEIYLSDPNRVPKERLRTILRYPVE